ncbi:uncharacterized protein LOC110415666 [Herrania umbratica]|uniref:Uncharacterized protein LOC110415666 n=1 Tax=Herrania umbratica TaxID=108875 RepID=A0A6J1A859_9ROSI|nr:uncharacterized protein LOC110415666 [Herrania umbratica]
MTGTNHENTKLLVPPKHLSSYNLRITINIPMGLFVKPRVPFLKGLFKFVLRTNHVRGGDAENSSTSKKKHGAKSRKSFKKRVGAMFSNVVGNKKSSPETDSGSSSDENGEAYWNGDWDQMENSKKIVERSVGMESAKITRKKSSANDLNGGVQQMVVATGLGISKSRMFKEMLEDEDKEEKKLKQEKLEDEDKEEERVEQQDKEEERVEQQVTVKKFLSKRTNYGLQLNKAEINKAGVGDNALSIIVVGDRDANTVDTRKTVMGKQEKKSSTSRTTPTTRRKLKIAWSMKKMMGGATEKQELCKKRILMGVRCRPIATIQYDENGVLLPDINP